MASQNLGVFVFVDLLLHLHKIVLFALLQIVDLAEVGRVQLRKLDVLHQQLIIAALPCILCD